MDIIRINPFRKWNKAAFSGAMHCPFCARQVDPTTTPIGFESTKTKIELVENIGPFIRVYRCKTCNGKFRYDINQQTMHPYSSFKRGLKLQGINYTGYVPLLNLKQEEGSSTSSEVDG